MRKTWLITTDHLEDELWFRDDEDFKVGMNYVAIQAACCREVRVLPFILMSNHVHFLLKGLRSEVEEFIDQFKHRYSMYMRRRWGIKEFLRRNGVQIKDVPSIDEAVERAGAYIQVNCVAANICSHPSQYPWGTGNCFFASSKPGGTTLASISGRERERILHSSCDLLPCNWHLTEEGYIPPQDYVDVEAVEAIYRTPKRMNYFLSSSSKAHKRLGTEENLPAFRDQVILAALPDLCRSLFHKDSFQDLSSQDQTECMRQIRFRFSADVNQIARVCGFSYAESALILDGV